MSEQIKVKIKGLYTEAPKIDVIKGNYVNLFSRELNLMTDPRFKPNDYYFDTYSDIDGYTQSNWGSLYRSKRDWYTKSSNEEYLSRYQGVPFHIQQGCQQINIIDVINSECHQVLINGASEYPKGVGLFFGDRPLLNLSVKLRYEFAKFSKKVFFFNMNIILQDVFNEETQQYEQNPILTQFISDSDDRYTYIHLNNNSLIEDLTEEEEAQRISAKQGFDNYYLSTDYHQDLFNNGELYYNYLLNGNGINLWDLAENGEGTYISGTQENPIYTSCLDVIGNNDIKFLSYVNRKRNLPTLGNKGEIIIYRDESNNSDIYYAWDDSNQKWSETFYDVFIEPMYREQRVRRDVKFKSINELSLGLSPFIFAANYLPSFKIKKDLI